MSDTHPSARLEGITPELTDDPHSCPLPSSAMMTAERVISIPHIRTGIIASLDDTGLHTAALVNKEWFSEVAPHLYSKLEVQLTDHHPTPDLKLHFVPKLPWPLEQLCSAARRVPGGEEEISDGLAWARQAAHRAVRCVMLPEHEYAGCDHYGEYDKLNPAIDKHQGKSAVLRIPRLEMYGHHYPIDCPVARMLDPAVMYLRVAEPRSRSIVPLSVSRQPLNDASAELHHNKAMCGKAVVDWNMEDSSSWFAFRGRVHAKVVVLFLPRFTPIPAPTSDTFENARHVEFVAIRICRLVRQCEFEQLILLNVADLEKYYQEHAKALLGSRAMSGRLQQGFEDYVYYSLAKSGTDEVLARNTIRFMTTDQYRASAIWGEEDEAMLMRGEVRQPYESGK